MSDPDRTVTLETQAPGLGASDSVRPAAATSGSSTVGSPTTPIEALRLDEVGRMRLLAGSGIAVAILAAAALVPMQGDQTAKYAHFAGLLAAGAASLWLYLRLGDPNRYQPWTVTVLAVFVGPGLASAFIFWGVFSSAVLFVPIVIYFVSHGESRWPAVVTLVAACIPHGVLGTLIATDTIVDPGVVRSSVMRPYEQLAVIGLAQFGFLVSYLLARMSRRSILDAVGQLDQAVRGVARREALLVEVKQELERALKVGGPGLYSGQTLGSYRLGNLLGRGAMGEVYEARHRDTDDEAAVKVLTPGAGGNAAYVQRFVREVEIARTVESPNIVRVLEVPTPGAAIPYLAMERLRGESLSDTLRDTTRLAPDRAVTLIEDVARGIAAAHAAGIVHRDLKPQNIFRNGEGPTACWKVLDFGVSKLVGHDGTLTQGMVVGTPGYMAPEQARGGNVDQRCDIYALGVIAYRVLTGLPPFSGPDVPAVLYAVTHSMPPKPSSAARLPEELDAVLAIALAKAPDDRFATSSELASALAEATHGRITPELAARAERVRATLDWGQTA